MFSSEWRRVFTNCKLQSVELSAGQKPLQSGADNRAREKQPL